MVYKKKKARVYKTRPSLLKRNGWEYTDVARSLKQARSFHSGGYHSSFAIIVKNKKGTNSFPYGIWTRSIGSRDMF